MVGASEQVSRHRLAAVAAVMFVGSRRFVFSALKPPWRANLLWLGIQTAELDQLTGRRAVTGYAAPSRVRWRFSVAALDTCSGL